MPFPTTTVIGPAWSQHHQGVAEGAMNATCTIGVPTGQTTYDPATDDTTSTWTDDYTGPCFVESALSPISADVAGQQVTRRDYLVQIPADGQTADIVPGARVRILTAPNDAQLGAQDLWVIDEQLGSERFSRVLVCSDNQSDARAS
jgi:hypothetical protein